MKKIYLLDKDGRTEYQAQTDDQLNKQTGFTKQVTGTRTARAFDALVQDLLTEIQNGNAAGDETAYNQ